MRIGLGADHAGCELKNVLASFLSEAGHQVTDYGTNDPAISVDYPRYAEPVARSVVSGQNDLGILVCGTGIGMAIAANKVDGVRAALIHDPTTARLAREHNDANVIAIGARITTPELALDLVRAFLGASFEARHRRRLDQVAQIEANGSGSKP